MPNFNGIVVTNSGKTLLAKAQQGKILNFSKMQLGSANDITNPSEKTTVTSPFLTTSIRNIGLTTDGSVRISTFVSNKDLVQSYVWREIGLFAIDPDTNDELLYAYKCAGEDGETIPAGGGADVIEKIFDIIIKAEGVANVTAKIEGSNVLLSTEEIVQELDNCADEQYKVPSAQLFYEQIQELNNKQDNIKNAIQRNIITASITNNITCNGNAQQIQFNFSKRIGNKLTLCEDGGILIGEDVRCICIYSNVFFSNIQDIGTKCLYIEHKRGTSTYNDLMFFQHFDNQGNICIPAKLLATQEGDVFYLNVSGANGDLINLLGTYLTVEAVG